MSKLVGGDQIRSDIMGPEHPDIKYLKQDDIGAVLAKGLAETYEANPKSPIEFFAKWLLNHGKTACATDQVSIYLITANNFIHIFIFRKFKNKKKSWI